MERRKRAGLIALLIALLLVVGLGILGVPRLTDDGPETPTPTETETETETPTPTDIPAEPIPPDEPTTTPTRTPFDRTPIDRSDGEGGAGGGSGGGGGGEPPDDTPSLSVDSDANPGASNGYSTPAPT